MYSHLGHVRLVVTNLMDIQQKSLAVDLPLILVKNRPKTAKSNEMTIAQKTSIYGISAFLLHKGIRLPKPWVASSNLIARSSIFRPSGFRAWKALLYIWDFQWKSRLGMVTNMET